MHVQYIKICGVFQVFYDNGNACDDNCEIYIVWNAPPILIENQNANKEWEPLKSSTNQYLFSINNYSVHKLEVNHEMLEVFTMICEILGKPTDSWIEEDMELPNSWSESAKITEHGISE